MNMAGVDLEPRAFRDGGHTKGEQMTHYIESRKGKFWKPQDFMSIVGVGEEETFFSLQGSLSWPNNQIDMTQISKITK